MPQESLGPELTEIETALGHLQLAPSRLDWDNLMFKAGAASMQSGAFLAVGLASIAATLAVALASESLVLAVRPGSRVIERVVVVHSSTPANSATPSGTDAPLDRRLRRQRR